MWPWNKKKNEEEEEEQIVPMSILPTVETLIERVINLTISPIDGQSDLNENQHNFSNPGPSTSASTSMERRLVPDPKEFSLPNYEVTEESLIFKQYKRLNPSTTVKKEQAAVIYSPDESKIIEVNSPNLSESISSLNKIKEEPPKKDNTKLSILKKIFKGKPKLKKRNIPSNVLPLPLRPKILIQTPDYPYASQNAEEVQLKSLMMSLDTLCMNEVSPKTQITRKTNNVGETKAPETESKINPIQKGIEKTSTESPKKMPSTAKNEKELFLRKLNRPPISNLEAQYILSSLNQPSTSKQMYIPFDEFCKMNDKRVSPINMPSASSSVKAQLKTITSSEAEGHQRLANTGSKITSTAPSLKKANDICKKPLANTTPKNMSAIEKSTPATQSTQKSTPVTQSIQERTPVTQSIQKRTPVIQSNQKSTPATLSIQKNTPVTQSIQKRTPAILSTQKRTPVTQSIQKSTLAKATSTSTSNKNDYEITKISTASLQTTATSKDDAAPKKAQKEFINRKNKNKKRAMRRQLRNIRQGIGEFGNRMFERGMKWLYK